MMQAHLGLEGCKNSEVGLDLSSFQITSTHISNPNILSPRARKTSMQPIHSSPNLLSRLSNTPKVPPFLHHRQGKEFSEQAHQGHFISSVQSFGTAPPWSPSHPQTLHEHLQSPHHLTVSLGRALSGTMNSEQLSPSARCAQRGADHPSLDCSPPPTLRARLQGEAGTAGHAGGAGQERGSTTVPGGAPPAGKQLGAPCTHPRSPPARSPHLCAPPRSPLRSRKDPPCPPWQLGPRPLPGRLEPALWPGPSEYDNVVKIGTKTSFASVT